MWNLFGKIRKYFQKRDKNKVIFVLGSNLSCANDVVNLIKEFIEKNNLKIEVIKCRNAGLLDEIFKKYPIKGVILMNEMRQYDPFNGSGMFLSTFKTGIDKFVNEECKKRRIVLMEIKENFQNGGSIDQQKNIADWLQNNFLF
ncbi:MAG: hypothetical protein PHP97_04875 [Candidatus Shapirobacteria bacterium]|nr:hypothetical protein [Candidatus Shapirobacteria bacterium]MDD4383315.1 hypothetical protein [Candidatus Shapirobacteria bacterium]